MTLNIFPSSMEARYAIAGSAIGALTSLVCLSAGIPVGHGLLNFFDSLANSLLFNAAIVFSALTFGYVAARAGRRLDQADRLLLAERAGVVELYRLAYQDALTGLGNRHALKRDTATLAGTADQETTLAAVILMDLDGFKEINDTFGHDAGDEVLSLLAGRLRSACDFDCRAYRLGGDEFVVLAEGPRDVAGMEAFVRMLSTKVFRTVHHAGAEIETSGSMGISFLKGGNDTLSAALKRADVALYRAKGEGEFRHAFNVGGAGQPDATVSGVQRVAKQAVEEGRLVVEYRPVNQAGTAVLRGFSASVVRSGDEAGSRRSCDIPGLVIEEWLLDRVIGDMRNWPAHLTVTIALSAQMLSRKGVANRLGERIAQAGLAPERFVIDVDFRAFGDMAHSSADDNVAALRAMGIRICAADLVAGVFDRARAANSPVDCWRIDIGRLRRAAEGPSGREVSKSLSIFADAMRLELRFEAVDTPEDLAFAARFSHATLTGASAGPALTADQATYLAARFGPNGRRLRKVVG